MSNEQLEEQLVALASVAKRQQAAAQTAVDGLAVISESLTKQLAVLKETIPQVRSAAEEAACKASERAFAGAAETAARAMTTATNPVLARLDGTLKVTGQIETRLKKAVEFWSWSFAQRLALVFGVGVLVAWALAWAKVAWNESDVRELRQRRDALSAEVEQLESQFMRLKLLDCESKGGPKGRKCLPIDVRRLYGERNADVFYYPVF